MTTAKHPTFSRRHYAAIAQELRSARTNDTVIGQLPDAEVAGYFLAITTIEQALVDMFHHDNPGFDPAHFREAARPEPKAAQ